MEVYKQYYTNRIFVFTLLWFLMTSYSYQALAKESSGDNIKIFSYEEMPTVLQLITDQTRDNYERINTWSGEIDKKINWLWTGAKAEEFFKKLTNGVGETPKNLLQKAEEKITFAIDTKKGFVYIDNFREKSCKFLNLTTGKELGISSGPYSSGPNWSTSIAKPDFFLEAKAESFDTKTNEIRHRKAIKNTSKQNQLTGLYEGVDDPRGIFMPGGNPWEHFDRLIKYINKSGKIEFDGYSLKMEEHIKGDNIEYKIIESSIVSLERSDPNHYIIITKVFSSQYGFNIVYWEVTSGSGMLIQRFSWEYELINGIYLPKRVVKKNYYSSGKVASEKDYTYINNKVNQEIPPGTFEYTNLKLKEGDIFIDKILNKEYRYKEINQTLQPVEK